MVKTQQNNKLSKTKFSNDNLQERSILLGEQLNNSRLIFWQKYNFSGRLSQKNDVYLLYGQCYTMQLIASMFI